MTPRMLTVTALMAAGASLTAACGEDPPTAPAIPVASVEIVTQSQTMNAFDQTVQLTAVARDASGRSLTGIAVSWSSSQPHVATVNASGLVTARSDGSSTITAVTRDVAGTIDLEVDQAPAQLALRQEPSGATLLQPFTVQPVVEVQDANGNLVEKDNETTVRVSIGAGGGFLTGTRTATAVAGVLTFTNLGIAGKIGGRTLLFSPDARSRAMDLVAATSQSFPLSAGAPNAVAAVQGDGQIGMLGEVLPDSLVMLATDAGGDAAAGEPADWRVTRGTGQITALNTTTDEHGLSRAVWTLGDDPGFYEVQAAVPGRGDVSFAARAVFSAATLLPLVGSALTDNIAAPVANVSVHGDYAYVGGASAGYNTSANVGVRIVDVSDPANSRVAGSIPLRLVGPGSDHTHGDAVPTTINTGAFQGDVAVVLNGVPDSFQPDAFPEPYGIWDVRDPASPGFLSVLEFSKAQSAFSVGDLGDKPRNARAIAGNYFYALYDADPSSARDFRLGVADISDPRSPVIVGDWKPTPNVLILSLSLNDAGTRAYVTGPYPGGQATTDVYLYVLDIQDPSQPVEIGRFVLPVPTGLYSTPSTAATSDDQLLILSDGGWAYPSNSVLHILDISDLGNITELSTFALPGPSTVLFGTGAWEVVVRDRMAYTSWFAEGVRAVDFSDPLNPLQAGVFISPNVAAPWIADVALLGTDHVVATTVWGSGMYILAEPQ